MENRHRGGEGMVPKGMKRASKSIFQLLDVRHPKESGRKVRKSKVERLQRGHPLFSKQGEGPLPWDLIGKRRPGKS